MHILLGKGGGGQGVILAFNYTFYLLTEADILQTFIFKIYSNCKIIKYIKLADLYLAKTGRSQVEGSLLKL